MTKRRSGGRDDGRAAKRQRRHLYLVFDDWSCGYSIRKVDLPSGSDSDDDADPPRHAFSGEAAEPRRPRALFRVVAPRGLPHYFASAFGTRIMVMHPKVPGADGKLHVVPKDLVPVYDVRTRGVIFGPRPEPDPADPIYIPVGDRLFALAADSFEQLLPPPLEHAGGERWVWSWYELPKPPFKRRDVTSYALHPDGRTILVSTERRATAATFAFDTEAACSEWKRLGEWTMPFAGRAHFDPELDAFVGLSKDPDTLGHLCSCDAPPTSSDAGNGQCPAPARKLGKEKLFSEDPAETHIGATLVYMGHRSRFCLVQCISIEDGRVDEEPEEEEDVPRPRRHVCRLTTFSLMYDKHGDLTTFGKSCRVH